MNPPITTTDSVASTRRSNDGGPRLLQRDEALLEIRHVLSGTWEHHGSPIVIEGQLGTGKTALLNASLKIGGDLGLRIGRAQCDAAESSTPFAVVRQVFASMVGYMPYPAAPIDDGTAVARRVLLGDWSSTDDPADAYQGLMHLLETCGPGAALVGIDDVHLADPVSAGWLQYVARRLNASSVHLVLTTQTTRVGAPEADPLELNPSTRRFTMQRLGIESTQAMMTGHLGAGITPLAVETAHRITGGNPLLIARMLTSLDEIRAQGVLPTEHQIATSTSPLVARSVLSRVSAMSEGALDLLEAIAVLGSADLRIAAAVAGIDGEEAGLLADALADVGVLGWERPLAFLHPFERHSVYAEMPRARRARAHTNAAQILAARGADAIEIARHLAETDPSGDEWTAAVLIEAARRQIAEGRLESAEELVERADLESPQHALRAELALLRAKVDGLLGRKTAVEQLVLAARLEADPAGLAEIALDLLDQPQDRSSFAVILEIARSVRDQLVADHPQSALRLELTESVLLPAHARGEPTAHEGELDDPELATSPMGRLLAIQQALRAGARMQGSYHQLTDTLGSMLTADSLLGGGTVRTAIIGAALRALVRVGAYEIADPLIDTARAGAEARGRTVEIAAYALVQAESLAMQGRIVEAHQALAGVGLDEGGAIQQCLGMERRWLDALRERGDHDTIAIRVIPTTAAPGLAELGASAAMFLAETTGRVQLLEGDWASALTNFDRLGSAAGQFGVSNPSFAPWRAGRCSALALLGRHKEGVALADENLRLARQFGSPITIAAALAVSARFQQTAVQIGLLEEAIATISSSNAELLRCDLLIDLGVARHQAGDAAAARVALRDGADQATRLGLTRLAAVAGRGLLACGARPRRLQTTGMKSLTPAEQRVVRLAADGHTNASIAAELFINMKTVESHLTRVYKKLRITDRAELKAALRSDRGALFEVSKAG